MVTGIECTGIVLAVLPLVIELAKAYSEGVTEVTGVTIRSKHDKKLRRFYFNFFWEMGMLGHCIQDIIKHLPNLSLQQKAALSDIGSLEKWSEDVEVEAALRNYLKTDETYNIWTVVMAELISVISQLTEDTTVHLETSDTAVVKMYKKLKQFESDSKNKQTSSTVFERITYRKRQSQREELMSALKRCNKCMKEIKVFVAEDSVVVDQNIPALTMSKKRDILSGPLRKLSQQTYEVIAQFWNCCNARHEARFKLGIINLDKTRDGKRTDLDFFVASSASKQSQWSWQEANIVIESTQTPVIPDRQSLKTICEGLVTDNNDHTLNLLLDNMDAQPTLYRLRNTPRKPLIAETVPACSLDDLLRQNTRLNLKNRRRLALIFAHSLIRYHTNTWLRDHWGKGHILFFRTPEQKIVFEHPYISTFFESQPPSVPNLNQFHKEPTILALGILLIEIELGKRIEDLRKPKESADDWCIADRVSKDMDECGEPYQKVVMSCLDVSWIPVMNTGSLDNQEVLEGYYRHVIDPLERDYRHLFQDATAFLD